MDDKQTARSDRRLELSDSAYKARHALEKLLKLNAEGRLTGESYLRIYFQNGAVRSARIAMEESVFMEDK